MVSGAFIAVMAVITAFVVGVLIGLDSKKIENTRLVRENDRLYIKTEVLSSELRAAQQQIQMHNLLDGV